MEYHANGGVSGLWLGTNLIQISRPWHFPWNWPSSVKNAHFRVYSVKSVIFREFNSFTFIYEGFGSNRIVLPLKYEGHLTGINISVWDGIQKEPMQVTKKSCLNGVCKGAWIISSERLITSIVINVIIYYINNNNKYSLFRNVLFDRFLSLH